MSEIRLVPCVKMAQYIVPIKPHTESWDDGITEEEARALAHAATNDGYFVADFPVVSKLRDAFSEDE